MTGVNTKPPSQPPCDFLPVLKWQLGRLAEDLHTIGGIGPENMQAWNDFFAASQEHFNRCRHCSRTLNEFVVWVEHTFPLPSQPKPKNVVWELFTDIVVGTVFNLMVPKIARDIGKMFSGDDKNR